MDRRIAVVASRMIAVVVFAAGPTFAQPQPAAKGDPAESFDTSAVYKTVDGRALRIYFDKPADWKASDRRPAIVFFHGGGWTGGTPAQFARQAKHLAARGMVAFSVSYRFASKENTAPPIDCIQDAKSALRWVRAHAAELGVDPQRIAAGGGSAGGHLAAFVGWMPGFDDPQDDLNTSPRPQALVLFNPVIDNSSTGFGANRISERLKEFSPRHTVTAAAPPMIVFVGSLDKLIRTEVLELFAKELDAVGVRCEVKVYEGQPHGFFNFREGNTRYYDETLAEADKFLTSLGWLKDDAK
jgi:acetyl esterase